ncbi:MAG: DUF4105 domain-containing protein, partial [Thermoguttaceae bacterium]
MFPKKDDFSDILLRVSSGIVCLCAVLLACIGCSTISSSGKQQTSTYRAQNQSFWFPKRAIPTQSTSQSDSYPTPNHVASQNQFASQNRVAHSEQLMNTGRHIPINHAPMGQEPVRQEAVRQEAVRREAAEQLSAQKHIAASGLLTPKRLPDQTSGMVSAYLQSPNQNTASAALVNDSAVSAEVSPEQTEYQPRTISRSRYVPRSSAVSTAQNSVRPSLFSSFSKWSQFQPENQDSSFFSKQGDVHYSFTPDSKFLAKQNRTTSNPASNSISQVAYYSNQPLIETNSLPAYVSSETSHVSMTASPELLKPWNFRELADRKNEVRQNGASHYRLVSDTSVSGTSVSGTSVSGSPVSEQIGSEIASPNLRTTPEQVPLERFVTSTAASNQSKTIAIPTETSAAKTSSIPIFNLGRDLMKEFRPSNDRKWSQNHTVLQTAEFNGNSVTVRNIRYSKYVNSQTYSTTYYDATFNLQDIRTIDLIVVPFRAAPRVAHVEASFGFADGRHLGMSIEARYEEGEKYDPVAASMNQFELIYVFADERDLIRIGTDVNKNDVHVYRLKFEPSEVREMFVDALQRANQLAAKPEFYHPITNSCVTNLIYHINKGRPKAIPREYRTLLPGLIDQYVYDL